MTGMSPVCQYKDAERDCIRRRAFLHGPHAQRDEVVKGDEGNERCKPGTPLVPKREGNQHNHAGVRRRGRTDLCVTRSARVHENEWDEPASAISTDVG
ncbi:hypothetical protein ARMSODRAFT_93282 [Armillaria solidipes]|uniref:Uncharacterized protein n=1 Tax=Armillaria solidipes TaxID=1076256 RepID=A0A2H3C686_9AGAR|nr:hypothetical protein ARMSODRAFT_93282 [Armillaria solidipes]